MSGSTNGGTVPSPDNATTPLTADELVMCRRFMGYPALGGVNSGEQSWRFWTQYGFNEWRFQTMAPGELNQVRSYLTNCVTLEAAIAGASDNLDTAVAAVWTHNPNEVADRIGLYNYWRNQLCGFFGCPPGPALRQRTNIVI